MECAVGFATVVGLLGPIFTDLVKRIWPDPEKQAEAQAELQKLLNEAQIEASKADAAAMEAKKDVITTEMQQGGWASQWRSYLMMVCISIVAYNWILVSFLNAFLKPLGVPIDAVAVPPELWTLVTVGLGGYLTKESINVYSQSRVDRAKAENPINEDVLAQELRRTLFKNGMSQAQWDAIRNAAEKANN